MARPADAVRIDRLTLWTGLAICALLAGVVVRVAMLQVHPGERLADHAGDRVASRPVQGYRGEILDRRGRLLSTSRLGYRAFIDPERIDRDRVDELIVKLSGAAGVRADVVGERLLRSLAINDERRRAASAAVAADQSPQSPLDQLRLALNASALADEPSPADAAESGEGDAAPPLIRYVAMGDVLTDRQAALVRAIDLPGVHLERRPVREYPSGDVVASLLGKVGFENRGLMGAELTLEESLQAADGRARYVRDAFGRPLWIERGQWLPAQHGENQRLSVDLELQRIAHEELQRGMEDADAAGGRLVMLDPNTGEILAMLNLYRDVGELPEFPWVDREPAPGAPAPPAYNPATRYRAIPPDPARDVHPALGRNRCVEDIYEPGSTFKPFVWALVLESGLVKLDEVFDTEGGRWRNQYGRRFEDVTRRDEMTWMEVLVNSSNIGMVKGSSRLDFKRLREGLLRFGFGQRTGVPLPGESPGRMTPQNRWTHWTQESVASGYEIAATPLQLARAYCAFARSGTLAGTVPTVRLLAAGPGGVAGDAMVRSIPPEVALVTRRTLRPVAVRVEEKMASLQPPETGWRYQMWGKSGTAKIALGAPPEGKRLPPGMRGYFERQYNSSFVAGAPLEEPRLIVVVVIDDPGPLAIRENRHYGSSVAGPVARRVLERALTYLGVEPDLPPTEGGDDAGAEAVRGLAAR